MADSLERLMRGRAGGIVRDTGARNARSFPMALEFPHIVVLDGNLSDLDRVARMLSGRGFNITLSSTLLDEITLGSLRPDIILLDSALLPGRRAGARARMQASWLASLDQVPVLWCSTDHGEAPVQAEGGAVTLLKPLRERDVLVSVEALLHGRIDQQPAGTGGGHLPVPVVSGVPGLC